MKHSSHVYSGKKKYTAFGDTFHGNMSPFLFKFLVIICPSTNNLFFILLGLTCKFDKLFDGQIKQAVLVLSIF